MGYSLPQITEVLSKTDKTLYKVGAIAYENMFSELSESLDYERDIIFVYKKSLEWAGNFYVGDVRTDAIVERLSLKISIYDYGTLNPIYSGATTMTNAIPGGYYLYNLGDVNISNLQNNQVLTYSSVLQKWINAGTGSAVRNNLSFTATLNQTVFVTSVPFTVGLFDVHLNGVRLNSSNYSTFGEYTITLYDGCLADDVIDITIYDPLVNITEASTYVLKSTTITINGVTYDLSTNRTWTIDALPSQSGNNGKYLTTNGSIASWGNIDALPSQTGNSGKYLTTNGTAANWGTIDLSSYIPYTGATGAVSLGLFGLTAGTLTLQEQALNSSTYKLTQRMASNDYWSIYGFASVADYGDLYFELQDNAAFADGQRFRFHYGIDSSGTPKDILLMDYNSATIDGALTVSGSASIDGLIFDQTPALAAGVGVMRWNNSDGTLDLGLKGGNVTLQVGQEQVLMVVNKTGANLLESQYRVLRARNASEGGAQGQRIAVVLARANTKINHTGILGVATENISNNQEGFITSIGVVNNINTTGSLQGETWTDGDVLWLSESVAGGLTNIEPATHPIQIGYVTYAHVNNGKILVSIEQGVDELNELHDVYVPTPLAGQVITYDGSRWVNQALQVNVAANLFNYYNFI